MRFVVRSYLLGGDDPGSRVVVSSLEGAREVMRARLVGLGEASRWRLLDEVSGLQGPGVVGPLPDGTVFEVEHA